MIHVLFLALPFYSSDPCSFSVVCIQAVILGSAAVLVLRRPRMTLAGWEISTLFIALVMIVVPAVLAWSGAVGGLRTTTAVREWAGFLLLAVVFALDGRNARLWPPLIWIVALCALAQANTGSAAWWWGEGSADTARFLFTPSLALFLAPRDFPRHRWLAWLQMALVIPVALYLLFFAMTVELLAFLVVLVLTASRFRRASIALAALAAGWMLLAYPHPALDLDEPVMPVLAQSDARLHYRLSLPSLPPRQGYAWNTLTEVKRALPDGRGPGHERLLLESTHTGGALYAVPGAFAWEGLDALGYGFFVMLCGVLLLQLLGDAWGERSLHLEGARGLLLGLWVLSIMLPRAGFVACPLWWAMLGMMLSARPAVSPEEEQKPLLWRAPLWVSTAILGLFVALPLSRQLLAERAFPEVDNLDLAVEESIPRLEKALSYEPKSGAILFALAHAYYDRNLRMHGMRFRAVDETVISTLEESIEMEPDNGDYRWAFSRFLLLAGKRDESLYQEARAIALAPERLSLRRSLAETYENMGRYEFALREYQACADLEPFDADLRLAIARIYRAMREDEKALGEYRKVLRLRPDDPTAREYLKL